MNWYLAPALVVALLGLLSLSEATRGVGLIAFAVFLSVLGRIAQADAHHLAKQDNRPLLSSERMSEWITVIVTLLTLGTVAIAGLAVLAML